MKKFLVAALVAALLGIGVVGIASAHTSNPANLCTRAFSNWAVNRTVSAEDALVACLQAHTINANTSPFDFNTANFGFNNGFGFNPSFGFNPGFGGFIPFDGFGQTVSECPPGTSALEGGTVQHPAWTCVPGLGNRFPGICPLGLNLFETGPVSSPVWDCVL